MNNVPILCLALAVAGCASFSGYTLTPGVSTEAEMRSVMGQPAAEYKEADGLRRFAYPRGPLGTQTYMADVGGDGILKALRPVLNDGTFNAIKPGMDRDDVLRMIGPPGDSMTFALSRQFAWDYRYIDSWGYTAIFSVSFDEKGTVVSKFSRRIGQDHGRG
jgi:hypothetical protein